MRGEVGGRTRPPESKGQGNVLLVDDDEQLLRALGRRLGLDGFKVTVAASGKAGLQALERSEYTGIIVDFRLRDMTALEFLSTARDSGFERSIIVLSGYLDIPTTAALMRGGANDVLQKPASADQLGRALVGGGGPKTREPFSKPPSKKARVTQLIGRSRAMSDLRSQIERLVRAPTLSVFIHGETGTGKEVVARAIRSARAPREPFVPVNCAAIPATLFESELFGHEAGAFTDAKEKRAGAFELAGNGTLFLDEIGEMPAAQQAKLLRVLESRRFTPVGGRREIQFDGGVVSATNRGAGEGGAYGLRSDLFFRLSGVVLYLPPLRERVEDIEPIAHHFIAASAHALGRNALSIRVERSAIQALGEYSWPGNVRELRLVIEQILFWSDSNLVTEREVMQVLESRAPGTSRSSESATPTASAAAAPTSTLPEQSAGAPSWPVSPRHTPTEPIDLRAIENDLIMDIFEASGQNVSETARRLGLPRTTIRDRLKRLMDDK